MIDTTEFFGKRTTPAAGEDGETAEASVAAETDRDSEQAEATQAVAASEESSDDTK